MIKSKLLVLFIPIMAIIAWVKITPNKIVLRIRNPYNSNKTVGGVISKWEEEKWTSYNDFRVTDNSGILTLDEANIRVGKKLRLYYTDRYNKTIDFSVFNLTSDTQDVYLDYNHQSDIVSYQTKKSPSSAYFCNNLDSLNFDNCRFIDLSGENSKKINQRLSKFGEYIEILILDSTTSKKIPRCLRKKNRLRILSYKNSYLWKPQTQFKCQPTIRANPKGIYRDTFFLVGNEKILYRTSQYEFFVGAESQEQR